MTDERKLEELLKNFRGLKDKEFKELVSQAQAELNIIEVRINIDRGKYLPKLEDFLRQCRDGHWHIDDAVLEDARTWFEKSIKPHVEEEKRSRERASEHHSSFSHPFNQGSKSDSNLPPEQKARHPGSKPAGSPGIHAGHERDITTNRENSQRTDPSPAGQPGGQSQLATSNTDRVQSCNIGNEGRRGQGTDKPRDIDGTNPFKTTTFEVSAKSNNDGNGKASSKSGHEGKGSGPNVLTQTPSIGSVRNKETVPSSGQNDSNFGKPGPPKIARAAEAKSSCKSGSEPKGEDHAPVRRRERGAAAIKADYEHMWDYFLEEARTDILASKNISEADVSKLLVRILQNAYKFCVTRADGQILDLHTKLISIIRGNELKGQHSKRFGDVNPRDLEHLVQYRTNNSHLCAERLKEEFIEKQLAGICRVSKSDSKSPKVQAYARECVDICWRMRTDDQPIGMDTEDPDEQITPGSPRFAGYGLSGALIWPALYYNNNSVLVKGFTE